MSEICRYYKRGNCKLGAKCKYRHGVIPRQRASAPPGDYRYCYSVPLPKHLPCGVVAGKGRCHLNRIEEGLQQRVHLFPCEGEIKVYLKAPDTQLFSDVKEKLEHLIAMLFIGRKVCVRLLVSFDGVGTRHDMTLRFMRYEGTLLNHLTTNPNCKDGVYFLRSADETCHYDEGHGSAAGAHPTHPRLASATHPRLASATHPSLILDCGEVTEKLQYGLKDIKRELEHNQNLRGKLEARFGRKVWYSLPKELLDEEVDLTNLEKMFDDDKSHIPNTMNTSIDATKVEMLNRELEQLCQKKHVVEVYNFTVTLPFTDQRKSVEVRVVAMDGTLKIVRVKKNEKRAAAIDVLCLNRQHDFRLEVCHHENVRRSDPEYSSVKKLVRTMYIRKSGILSFCPYTEQWTVELLRYKRQSTFVLEDTFLVTLSDVKECKVNWERYGRDNQGDPLEVNLEDFSDRHWELELNSILWECAFAKDAQQPPEEALSLYMEHPSVDDAVMAMVQHPWKPETLISQENLHSVLQKVDWLSGQLEL
ncbi:hypothetical protein EMCRGX_G026014 [Ephydatia muelleri]